MVDFFVCKKIIQERMVSVMKIIKQEIQFEESLKQRLEFICEFSKVNPTFIKGSIRKLDKTNLSYIEPHKVIVKNTILLVFNYSNDVYISNLSKKIKLSELETYLKKGYSKQAPARFVEIAAERVQAAIHKLWKKIK